MKIGVSAENIKTEDNAGKFNCDITADEVESGKKIIIENQLGIQPWKLWLRIPIQFILMYWAYVNLPQT
jgi:hypothetical protein